MYGIVLVEGNLHVNEALSITNIIKLLFLDRLLKRRLVSGIYRYCNA